MPNPIKYTAGTETLALKKGNFYIGTGDVGKGPSDTTGYYQGPSPTSGGYVVYLNKNGVPGNLSYHSAANDSQLISFTNNLSGTSFTSATQCLNYYATQTDKVCFNRDYEPIVTNGLIFNLDAGFTPSYSRSGTTWYDVDGSNNGTLTNSPTFNSGDGGGIVFDGVDDYVSGTEIAELGYTNNYTVIIWLNNTNNGYVLANKSNDGERFGINISNGTLSGFFFNGSFYTTVGRSIRTEAWEQVVVVNQNQQLTLYVSMNKSTTGGNAIDPGQNGLRIGRRNRTSEIYFNGRISQIQVYNRAMAESEILSNYQAMLSRFVGENIVTNGLVFYVDAGYPTSYPTSGLTWYDVSGYNNNGTLTNGPTYSGTSIVFDGTDDYVNFGNKNNLGSEPFTINTWFNHIPDGDYQGVITKGTGSGIGIGYRILVTPNGKAYFDVSDNVTSNTFISNTGVGSNTWVNVVLVRESSNTFKGYINGVLDKTETKTVGSCTTSYDLRIGGQFDASQYAFKGSISIASIYNRALSASEVLQNYNAQKGRFGL
jgi:hypothetical protein